MKANSIICGLYLAAIFSFGLRAESLPREQKDLSATGAIGVQVPTLKLLEAKARADRSIEFQIDSTEGFKVLIESSADLEEWTSEGLHAPNAAIVFTNKTEPGAHRFYRASDYTLRIEGIVRDIQTDLPVAQAKVTIADLAWQTSDLVTQTDAQGVFHAVVSREYSFRRITVEKVGYDLLVTEPRVYSDNSNIQLSLWLAAPGYRPPNDDFQNRFSIEGTNSVIRTHTFAATTEPGHSLVILFDDYSQDYRRNLWWTWTAPKNGAVLIERDLARDDPGVIVFTGQTIQELIPVWDSSNPENAFFVKQGVQYQINFGTLWPAETGFTLRMVDPVPPFAVHAWVGTAQYLGSPISAVGEAFSLTATANGTSPLSYQWRKDGLDIPGATNTFFHNSDLKLNDAGAYSVLVTNQAGMSASEEIMITVLQERPQRPELLQGTWIQETSQGSLTINFADREFTANRASDNSAAGSGQFRFSESGAPNRYRLVLTYAEPSPELVRFFWIWLTSPDTGSYHETGSDWYPSVDYDSGSFTRAP